MQIKDTTFLMTIKKIEQFCVLGNSKKKQTNFKSKKFHTWFNGTRYRQVKGAPMCSPIIVANIFMENL